MKNINRDILFLIDFVQLFLKNNLSIEIINELKNSYEYSIIYSDVMGINQSVPFRGHFWRAELLCKIFSIPK